MNRSERREIKERKWVSKLKKLWNSYSLLSKLRPVKSNIRKYNDCEDAETYDNFKKDKYGVLFKKTSTISRKNKLNKKDIHKRDLKNKQISKEDLYEINTYMEDINDPYSFEKYCANCDNFKTENCKFPKIAMEDTKWKDIGCDSFYD